MLHIKPHAPAAHQDAKTQKSRKPLPMILHPVWKMDQTEVILGYLESLGTPRALAVWLLYKYGEHRQVVEYSIDSRDYITTDGGPFPGPTRFRVDYAASKFLSKCQGLKTGIDLEGVAIASALRAEEQCLSTNQRLRAESSLTAVMPDLVAQNFSRITSIIGEILDEFPTSFPDVGWSPGRTSSVRGTEVASLFKYTGRLDVTLSALPAALKLLRESPIWGAAALDADGPVSVLRSAFTIVEGNTMITVPKNAKTDRVICYEPHMNIRLQLAVGTYIRKRLARCGVNLNDQSVNQRRALLGSKTGHLATIDLSMASDTMSRELVAQLLPIDWLVYLDSIRSWYTTWPDGSTRKCEKFSSMGNGFTFELESLIFYALASAVAENVSVYGDDIIIKTSHYEDVKSVLEWAGFSLNEKKSFAVGNFRESCGVDAFAGLNCSPAHLDSLPKTVEGVVHLHNRVREWCMNWGKPPIHYHDLLEKWRNSHTCLHGPSGYGDGHYHVDWDRMHPRAAHQLDGWWFKTYTPVSRVSYVYGDRMAGCFSGRLGWGALCTSIGPKRSRDIVQTSVDRRLFYFKPIRVLASFSWPTVNWDFS